jgi:hypothetical protein
MLIPNDKYTQKQLNLWMRKAISAREQYQQANDFAIRIPTSDLYRDQMEENLWGVTFLAEITYKVMSEDVWNLSAYPRFGDDGMIDEELPTQEFSFLLLTADKYCWDKNGYLLRNGQHWNGDEIPNGFKVPFRTNMVYGPFTIWTDKWKYYDGKQPDSRGWGNIQFNGAMINHGTDDEPKWSSHS